MDIVWLLHAGISLMLIYVCYTDIRWRRIPNRATLIILLFSLSLGFVRMPYPSIVLPGVLLVSGFFVVMVGLIGAGDIKLIGVLAVALSASETSDFLLLTGFAGIPVSIVSLLYFYFFARDVRTSVPYALAISGGYWLQIAT